jgi:hypothetical protein
LTHRFKETKISARLAGEKGAALRDWLIAHIALALIPPTLAGIIVYLHGRWSPQRAKESARRGEFEGGSPRAAPWGRPARPQQTPRWTLFGFSYIEIGYILGALAGILTFIAAYIYCIVTYGFLFGLGLGWLPSMILAVIVGWVVVILWGPILVVFSLGLIGTVLVILKFGHA